MSSFAESGSSDEEEVSLIQARFGNFSNSRTYGPEMVFVQDKQLLSFNGKRKQTFEVKSKKPKYDVSVVDCEPQFEIPDDFEGEDIDLEDPLSNAAITSIQLDHDYAKRDFDSFTLSPASTQSPSTSTASLNSPNVHREEEFFLQRENCVDTADYLPLCRECKRREKIDKVCCRFFEFRKLKSISGKLTVYGFLDPHIDPNAYDINLWSPSNTYESAQDKSHPRLNFESLKYLLKYVLSQFCALIEEEKDARKQHLNEDKVVAWKRSVQGVREICDVCATSLFNYHWTCTQCGFSVCLDCYKDRKGCRIKFSPLTAQDRLERDEHYWLKCTSRENHDIRDLMLTQIIAGDALEMLNKRLHEICRQWKIEMNCECLKSLNPMNDLDLMREMEKRNVKTAAEQKVNSKNSHIKYPNVKHEWICDENMLRFLNPLDSDEAYQLFQEQWKAGHPIIISNCIRDMNMSIWNPDYFISNFGDRKNILVDCSTHHQIDNQSMDKFWQGFIGVAYRLRNRSTNQPMVLKLKDWPPSDDFAEILPRHFRDIMDALPLPHYTSRTGKFNLASHLPKHFVKPDLVPKMYSAYGHSDQIKKGSTNLHLDISDAVNVMVYVSLPQDLEYNKHPDDQKMIKSYDHSTIITAINDSRCDSDSRKRFNNERYHVEDKSKRKMPGAFWHIYDAKDAAKIRELLSSVALEQGTKIEVNSDPIHDQNFYLDSKLRDRLVKDYDVRGYSFIQFAGDAVFIPAGAPHQVRNIYDCIKVAEDFVSPENIRQCFKLTEEFRSLSEVHSNHEDKLQIKNILYHTVKNILSHFATSSNAGDDTIGS